METLATPQLDKDEGMSRRITLEPGKDTSELKALMLGISESTTSALEFAHFRNLCPVFKEMLAWHSLILQMQGSDHLTPEMDVEQSPTPHVSALRFTQCLLSPTSMDLLFQFFKESFLRESVPFSKITSLALQTCQWDFSPAVTNFIASRFTSPRRYVKTLAERMSVEFDQRHRELFRTGTLLVRAISMMADLVALSVIDVDLGCMWKPVSSAYSLPTSIMSQIFAAEPIRHRAQTLQFESCNLVDELFANAPSVQELISVRKISFKDNLLTDEFLNYFFKAAYPGPPLAEIDLSNNLITLKNESAVTRLVDLVTMHPQLVVNLSNNRIQSATVHPRIICEDIDMPNDTTSDMPNEMLKNHRQPLVVEPPTEGSNSSQDSDYSPSGNRSCGSSQSDDEESEDDNSLVSEGSDLLKLLDDQ